MAKKAPKRAGSVSDGEDEAGATERSNRSLPATCCAVLLLSGNRGEDQDDVLLRQFLNSADIGLRDDQIGSRVLSKRPQLYWNFSATEDHETDKSAGVKSLKTDDAAGLTSFLNASPHGAICYALLPQNEIEYLTAEDRSFKSRSQRGALFRFDRIHRPPFKVCVNADGTSMCPCAYRHHLVLMKKVRSGINAEVVEVLGDDETSLANLFVQPIFGGTAKPLTLEEIEPLFETNGNDTTSRITSGLLLPPVTYFADLSTPEKRVHERQTVAIRHAIIDTMPQSISATRAGVLLTILNDHLFNSIQVEGGSVSLQVESGMALKAPTARTDARVLLPSHPSARYAKFLLSADSQHFEMAWVSESRGMFRDRVNSYLTPQNPAGQVRWEQILVPPQPDPCRLTLLSFDEIMRTYSEDALQSIENETSDKTALISEIGENAGGLLRLISELDEGAGIAASILACFSTSKKQFVAGGAIGNVAQYFFKPVTDAIFVGQSDAERWKQGGKLADALFQQTPGEVPALQIQEVLELLKLFDNSAGIVRGYERDGEFTINFPEELAVLKRVIWYVTPMGWRCEPFARLPSSTQVNLRVPFRTIG